MNTSFLLMAQYSGKAIIPVEDLCRDYFPHLTPEKFIRKVTCGDIKIPLIRIEESQKAAKGVHIDDLAEYLDLRRSQARREFEQFHT
ncbi:pyocin activator PrtN family protein [Brucella anthropi]|uniref:pyocin activator PrtN family protein n=1 Tax=Brucella anthropi TaxID=529 RepID=UPI00125DA9EF|nr:pyocin activator PrtN family protein [Brucella anthropi]QFP61911.1 Pyocin activator protein PrtN [Brucella anthropi]